MHRTFIRRLVSASVLATLVCLIAGPSLDTAFGADKKSSATKSSSKKSAKSSKSKSTSKKAADKDEKEASKPKGRLPVYFSQIVDEEQRAEIYEIQSTYAEKLAELKKEHADEIKELDAEEDAEIEDVLSTEQKKELAELRAKRKLSSKKTSTKKNSTRKSSSKK